MTQDELLKYLKAHRREFNRTVKEIRYANGQIGRIAEEILKCL